MQGKELNTDERGGLGSKRKRRIVVCEGSPCAVLNNYTQHFSSFFCSYRQ